LENSDSQAFHGCLSSLYTINSRIIIIIQLRGVIVIISIYLLLIAINAYLCG
jgi:hypothetical protein